MAKKQIDLYFADLNARGTAQSPPQAQTNNSALSQQGTYPPEAVISAPTRLLVCTLLLFLILLPLLFSLDRGAVVQAQNLLICCIPVPIIVLLLAIKKTKNGGTTIGRRRKTARIHLTAPSVEHLLPDHRTRLRRRGEQGDEISREKWTELQKQIEKILSEDKLKDTLGPAEECLSLIGYLAPREKKQQSTRIDPLNMLIERLIEEHELEWADKLSHHYLGLLSGDLA